MTKLDQKKWLTYAAAGAAAAFTTATAENDAYADIHYSGIVNLDVTGSYGFATMNTLVTGTKVIGFGYHVGSFLGLFGVYGQVAGFTSAGFLYASKLPYGLNVSTLPSFNPSSYFNTLGWGYGYGNSQWLAPGQGYAAFWFNVGAGTQWGWARLDMVGAPNNGFTIVDYAYGDVGQSILTGQTSAIPEPSSLGALALGAAGLLSWRRSRRKEAQTAA